MLGRVVVLMMLVAAPAFAQVNTAPSIVVVPNGNEAQLPTPGQVSFGFNFFCDEHSKQDLSSLGLEITIDDAEGDLVFVAAAIDMPKGVHLSSGEWVSEPRAVPYKLKPRSGRIRKGDGPGMVTLIAEDANGARTEFVLLFRTYVAGGGACCGVCEELGGAPCVVLAMLAFATVIWRTRRRVIASIL